jgi:hypothetical protein
VSYYLVSYVEIISSSYDSNLGKESKPASIFDALIEGGRALRATASRALGLASPPALPDPRTATTPPLIKIPALLRVFFFI